MSTARETVPTQQGTNNSTVTAPGAGGGGARPGLKQELRRMSFSEGERALSPEQAPVQAKAAPGGPLAQDDAPALTEAELGGLRQILPMLATAVDSKNTVFVASLAQVAKDTAGLIEQGSSEDAAFSLWLNWVVMLPKQAWLGDTDPTMYQVIMLDAFEAMANERLQKEGKNPKLEAWVGRVEAMRSVYASMLKGFAKPGDTEEQTPVSGSRQAVIGLALAQVGKIHSGAETDVDDAGRPARKGWRSLKLIFDAAWGGSYPNQDVLKHKRLGKVLKHGSVRDAATGEYKDSDFKQGDQLPSWCGIFPTAMTRVAGLGVPVWDSGGVNTLPVLQPPDVPRPGDIVNKVANNHFGIVTWVGPLPEVRDKASLKKVAIRTVEGNTDGGQVLEHTSVLGSWDAGGWGIRQLEPPPKAAAPPTKV